MTMYDYDPRLAADLHAWAADAPVPPAPTRAVLARGRRARRRRVLAVAASVTALAFAAGALGIAAVTDRAPETRIAATRAPGLRLAAAVAATGGSSYTQTIGISVEGYDRLGAEDRAAVGSLNGLTMTGPFDPATVTGYLRTPDGGEQRLIGGDLYVGDGSAIWKKVPGKQTGFSVAGLVSDRVALTTDPTRFLETLRGFGAVERSGNVYRFSGSVSGYQISGEVTVADTRIVRFTYRVPAWPTQPGRSAVVALVTVDLSNHGAPVAVERPARVVD